jgi:hypothetical protein
MSAHTLEIFKKIKRKIKMEIYKRIKLKRIWRKVKREKRGENLSKRRIRV